MRRALGQVDPGAGACHDEAPEGEGLVAEDPRLGNPAWDLDAGAEEEDEDHEGPSGPFTTSLHHSEVRLDCSGRLAQ